MKRNFHHRKPKKPTAAEHELANNVGALVCAAAGKLLRDRYGWTTEAAAAFVDALPAAVNAMAGNINGVFNERSATARDRAEMPAAPALGGALPATANGDIKVTAAPEVS